MDGTIRVRTAAWFATAVVVSVFATLLVMQEWRADAAPGDADATWVAVDPCRLFDYRPGEDPAGGKKTPLVAGAPATQQVTGNVGNCSIPTTGVVAVSMNVTVVQGTAQSNLRLYPADAAKEPVVSNLNWKAGDSATANKVDVKLSSTGAVKLANFAGSVNVIGDVVGFYTNKSLKELAATAGVAGPQGPTGPQGEQGETGPAGPSTELPPVGQFTLRQIVKDAILECASTSIDEVNAVCVGPTLNGVDIAPDVASVGAICDTVIGTTASVVIAAGAVSASAYSWNGSNWVLGPASTIRLSSVYCFSPPS
jgi:hypothetical protein